MWVKIRGVNSTFSWPHFSCPLMYYQVQAATEADKPQIDLDQDRESTQSQTSASSPSAFKLMANAFRMTFSVTNPSSSSNTAVTMFVCNTFLIFYFKHYIKSAVGYFLSKYPNLSSFLVKDEKKAGKHEAQWVSVCDAWGGCPLCCSRFPWGALETQEGCALMKMLSMPCRGINLFLSWGWAGGVYTYTDIHLPFISNLNSITIYSYLNGHDGKVVFLLFNVGF